MRNTLLILFLLSILPLFGLENDTLKSTPKYVTGSVDQIHVDTTGSAWITIAGDSTDYTFDPPDGAQQKKVFVETKNYAKATPFKSSFYKQFKAYISNDAVTDMNQIRYYFRANSGVTKAERVQKFKSMIKSNAKDIFDLNPNLFKSLKKENGIDFIEDWEDLKVVMQSQTISENHPVFNFIEIY